MDLNSILKSVRKEKAENFKRMRKEANLTQEQLSSLSNLSQGTIRTMENGSIGWNSDSETLYINACILYSQQNNL